MAHKHHPALRSGLYSALGVLPTESKAGFRKLNKGLVDEFHPDGASEIDLVDDIARLMWRKQNMHTYRLSYQARRLRHQTIAERMSEMSDPQYLDVEQVKKEVEEEVRLELATDSGLLDLGPMISDKGLEHELNLSDRFDAAIARKIKQLFQLKAMKQVVQLAPNVPKLRRLEAPSAALPDPEAIAPATQSQRATRN
jgi:hypothetical protein